MPTIHQFVPTLLKSDAVGSHVLEIAKVFEANGIESEIFVNQPQDDHVGIAHLYSDYPRMRKDGDILLYHVASASPMADFLASRKERIMIDYHNITPAHFFRGWDDRTSDILDLARMQLQRLSDITSFAMADSEFNRNELDELGFSETAVVPILFGQDNVLANTSPIQIVERVDHAGRGPTWLFVGRITPCKAQHNLIAAFAAYRSTYAKNAKLILVGKPSPQSYFDALGSLAEELDVADSVMLTNGVSAEQLQVYYAEADVFVSLSEHEGFCVPLLEAMHQGLPVVALASSAVPETLGNSGLLLERSDPFEVAAAVDLILSDLQIQSELLGRSRTRMSELSLEKSTQSLLSALRRASVIPGA